MRTALVPIILSSCLLHIDSANGACFDPSPAFPPPDCDASDTILASVFTSLEKTINTFAGDHAFNTTSFSVEVTSSQSTLWSFHHTARELNASRPGANPVNEDSFYRIASITKVFTVLAVLQQSAAGNLSLDDPVNKYLPDLKGNIPWKDMTLRTLASQLSGIPRDWSQGDLLGGLPDPASFGLPPPNNTNLPACYGYNESHIPCTTSDLYYALSQSKPVFPPNQHSTYSNTAFELLGLVLADVTSLSFEDAIAHSILSPLNMSTGATFLSPPDNVSVLPADIAWYHDVDQGVHNPTGGLFYTTSAMSKFLRHILTHFNSPSTLSLATGNWLTPHSFTASPHSFYGMPFEIFRPNNILLHSKRAVSFYTKSGGVPGYTSIIVVAPEYNLGFTMMVAGNGAMLDMLREEVTVQVIRAAEKVAERQMTARYVGTYGHADGGTNSSITLSYTPAGGLFIEDWISNSTAVLQAFSRAYPEVVKPGARAQLVPTLLYVDEETQKGERWRVVIVPPRLEEEGLWDEFCLTDIDFLMYDGRPLNEVVFWDDGTVEGRVGTVELTAFRVRLGRGEREQRTEEEEGMLVQDGLVVDL